MRYRIYRKSRNSGKLYSLWRVESVEAAKEACRELREGSDARVYVYSWQLDES
jgi:hypothetical protein